MPDSVPTQALPAQPHDADGPVFREPWQAQAFALAVKLHEAGIFTWAEWSAHLGAEIRAARARGEPELDDSYYRHWLAALERLVTEKGVFDRDQLSARRAAWAHAYRATPHGLPVTLGKTGPD